MRCAPTGAGSNVRHRLPGNSESVGFTAVWRACQLAAQRADLEHKHIHPHTLRHCLTIPLHLSRRHL